MDGAGANVHADPPAHPRAHRGPSGGLGQRAAARPRMPLYSRMGAYDVGLLERAQGTPRQPRRMVEVLGARPGVRTSGALAGDAAPDGPLPGDPGKWGVVKDPELEASLLAEVRERGASTARDLDDGLPRSKEQWGWNWSNTAGSSTSSISRATSRSLDAPASSVSTTCQQVIPADIRGPADAEPRGRQPGAGASERSSPGNGHGAVPARLPAGCTPGTCSPRSTSWSRRVSSCRSRSTAGSGRRTYTRDARLPRRGRAGHCSARSTRSSGSASGPVALRLPLQDRDLRARAPAGARVLRAAVPAGDGSWPGSTSRRTAPVAASS